ncbi:MAG: YchJ family protein [Acinetobacter sp.]
MTNQMCPCGHGQYSQCCQPLHAKHVLAQSAEQLMRSRYSAFACQKIDYIVETTALLQQSQLDSSALLAWSQHNQWQKLEIVRSQPKVDPTHAMVEFKAYYFDGKSHQIHHEQSYFVQHQQRWYFLDPTVAQFPGMKQICVCGSHKKFKHCCASFLL